MRPTPIFGFSKLTDDALNTKAEHILASMNGNTNFPDATEKVVSVKAAKEAFNTARIAAVDGGKAKTADKDKKRKLLEKALKELALYVQLNCNNDVAILLTSGYDAQHDGEPIDEPGAPENFKIEAGNNSGSVIASVDSDENARAYVYESALEPETGEPIWRTELGKRKFTIKNLIAGKKYLFRAAIKGSSENLVYSEIISRFVA